MSDPTTVVKSRAWRDRLLDRHAWVDAVVLLLMGAAVLAGLASTFTGWTFLVVGLGGLALGLLVTRLASVLDLPPGAGILGAIGVFYLFGGLACLPADRLPVPHTWGVLTDRVVFGWKDLLTTLPPVDGQSTLLVLPWALGLAIGSLGLTLAGVDGGPRWIRTLLPAIVPAAALALVILLGIRRPQSLFLQGTAFAALLLAWLTARGLRIRVAVAGRAGRGSRFALGVAILAIAAAFAQPLGTWAAGDSTDRVILRDAIKPPFDVGQYPSPLASFRRYVEYPDHPPPENLFDKPLFTITGVDPGTRVRFATLDRYDGTVWGAANNAIPGAADDTYQRVSSTIDNPVVGTPVSATVTIEEGYTGVWLPVSGALQSIHFEVGDPELKSDSFRYNLAASAAVVPSGLRLGDRYRFTAVLPDDTLSPASVPGGNVGESAAAATFLDPQATEWSAGEKTEIARLYAIAHHLRDEGKYTDGVAEAEKIYHAGHYRARLQEFVTAPIMAGNDEQYAATMALLAARVGVPARVVLGAVVPDGGEVSGRDVQAWVEVRVADGSWRTLPTEEFMGDERPAELPPQPQQNQGGTNVPPPAPIPPPSTLGEQSDVKLKAQQEGDDETARGPLLPTWAWITVGAIGGPLAALLAYVGLIVGVKALRRRARRRRARVSARVGGAWRELVDHARDLGQAVPATPLATRREQSRGIDSPSAVMLARRADAHVFGPEPPLAEEAEAYWTDVDAERRAMSASAGRRQRARAAVSLRTFGRA